MSAAAWHTCAVRESGELACWGRNAHGQTDAPPGTYRSVDAKGNNACALRESGELACWGRNAHGQTDAPPGRWREVSLGWYHACALRESGELACWGAMPPAAARVPAELR